MSLLLLKEKLYFFSLYSMHVDHVFSFKYIISKKFHYLSEAIKSASDRYVKKISNATKYSQTLHRCALRYW